MNIHVNKVPTEAIEVLIRKNFNLRPSTIIKELGLKAPIYSKTVAYGHFGKEGMLWEMTNKANILREEASNLTRDIGAQRQ